MASLLDTVLNKNTEEIQSGVTASPMQAAAAPLSKTVTSGAMQDIASQTLAGLSGKAQAPQTGPQTASLLQQADVQTAKLQDRMQQQTAQQVQADQDLKLRQQAMQMTNAQLEQRSQGLNMRQKMQQQLDGMLQEFEQNKTELETNRMKAKVEQASTLLRLSNDKYIYKLKAEGRKSRLDKQLRFKEEMNKTLWAKEMDLFNNDLQFKRILKSDERQFERELGKLDINAAMKLAMGELDWQQEVAKYGAISTGISGLVQAGKDVAISKTTGETEVNKAFGTKVDAETMDEGRFSSVPEEVNPTQSQTQKYNWLFPQD